MRYSQSDIRSKPAPCARMAYELQIRFGVPGSPSIQRRQVNPYQEF